MENSFKAILDESKSILILLPTKPYFDQVAAGLALHLALRDKKEVQISCPTPMIVEFNRLVGVNKVTTELGNKNLIVRFVDYRANNIERVSYDIENGQFRLTVIPKQRFAPPGKNQIEFSYSGISADCVILIGGANESHFPAVSSKDIADAKVIHIGVKDLSLSGKSLISFSQPTSSISELLAGLMKESGLSFDEDIATNLLMGVEEGSDKFADANVTAATFELAAELIRAGGRRVVQTGFARETYPPGAIPGELHKQKVETQIEEEPQEEEPPKDWLQPKIYKGTSIS